jgi:structural maintenance of chromosome 2
MDSKQELQTMLSENNWIEQEKQFFGQEIGTYNFKKMDIRALKEKIKGLKSYTDDQKKRVNFKVDAMFDDTNAKYEELLTKKDILETNKEEVLQSIEFLNKAKNEELEKTWKIVNKNFSEIFSTLLPNASAKLELAKPEEGVEKGLQLKVAFSGTWIESLNPLSGGQRSLLALSLILALLRF